MVHPPQPLLQPQLQLQLQPQLQLQLQRQQLLQQHLPNEQLCLVLCQMPPVCSPSSTTTRSTTPVPLLEASPHPGAPHRLGVESMRLDSGVTVIPAPVPWSPAQVVVHLVAAMVVAVAAMVVVGSSGGSYGSGSG